MDSKARLRSGIVYSYSTRPIFVVSNFWSNNWSSRRKREEKRHGIVFGRAPQTRTMACFRKQSHEAGQTRQRAGAVCREEKGRGWVAEESKGVIDRSPVYEGPRESNPTDKRVACRPYIDFREHGPSISWPMFGIFLGKREQAPTTGLWLVKALSSGL